MFVSLLEIIKKNSFTPIVFIFGTANDILLLK